VINAREATWRGGNGRSAVCDFEAGGRFEQIGFNVAVIEPGELATLYHAEDAEEDFLVLEGECLLLVAGEERRLKQWDFFHSPPDTPHAIVAGDRRCIVVQVGARPAKAIVYPDSELARRHGVGVEQETRSVAAAYGDRRRTGIPYGGWLD
jgi:uncharacterized cupin superfamily protein